MKKTIVKSTESDRTIEFRSFDNAGHREVCVSIAYPIGKHQIERANIVVNFVDLIEAVGKLF